ncbi:MAG: L-rhamnose isomerase [Spirochaetes bacterium]|nr:MAG: L-rhamnose isomerase [Spirochaetota bacterium]
MKYPSISKDKIEENYGRAKEIYSLYGVNTDNVLNTIKNIPLSMHCWQGDDVTGFEKGKEGLTGGGILATGNFPGKARTPEELRMDMEKAMSLIPGKHRINLHAVYAETGDREVTRDQLKPEHFKNWIDWAKKNKIGLDFNPTIFSHPLADSGYTLASRDRNIRSFWIRHAEACREIAFTIGKELDSPCINNLWIPDGSKDMPADRLTPRKILKDSLDEIYEKQYDSRYLLDSVESKLFGIGSEAYVVGSHEFYLGYVFTKGLILCLDSGHFHPTESIADKISSVLIYSKELLLHLSRGLRWDSDHVVTLNDQIFSIAQEVKHCNAFNRIHFALDFFDASINRITAWVTGSRAALKAILSVLLEPTHLLIQAEEEGNLGDRLALLEEFKTLPMGSVWDKFCIESGVPAGSEWLNNVEEYTENVLLKREK